MGISERCYIQIVPALGLTDALAVAGWHIFKHERELALSSIRAANAFMKDITTAEVLDPLLTNDMTPLMRKSAALLSEEKYEEAHDTLEEMSVKLHHWLFEKAVDCECRRDGDGR